MAWHSKQFQDVPIVSGREKVSFWAGLLLKVSLLLLVLITAKVFISNLQVFGPPESFTWLGKYLYDFSKLVLPIMALIPLFGYALINAHIAFGRVPDIENFSADQHSAFFRSRRKGVQFFIYSNLSVLTPMAIILSVLLIAKLQNGVDERNTFLSGAVAVTLLVSSICAKAVEEYTSAEA